MAPKSHNAKWKFILTGRRCSFQDVHGLFLHASPHHVICHAVDGPCAALTIIYPVTEGWLRNRGRCGIKRWHNRYFAFRAGKRGVISYWEREKDATPTSTPKAWFYVKNISSVSIDTMDNAKFFIHFEDGKCDIHLDAMHTAEQLKWLRALDRAGINIMWSVTTN